MWYIRQSRFLIGFPGRIMIHFHRFLSAAASLVLLASASVQAQTATSAGQQAFKQRCQVCHSVTAGAPAAAGPNLAGVFGRKAGSTSFRYSAAMAKAPMVWNKATLDKYLAAPTKAVPGTRMVIAVSDAKQRAAIIDYLAKAK
jgi:cytochrome c